jgi:hypothetical protein
VIHETLPIIAPSSDLVVRLQRSHRRFPMKKDTKNQKLLRLNKETIRKLDDLDDNDLKRVIGGGSCLPPPPPAS